MWHEWSPMKKLIWLRRVTSGMSYILKTVTGAIVHIMDAVAGPIDALTVAVEPVQNLNGYDNPWPAGGGKNLLQNTATTATVNGMTFTVNEDGSVSTSGTATANAALNIGTAQLKSGVSYILNGCPSGGSISKYLVSFSGIGYDSGSGYTYTPTDDTTVYVVITVFSGTNVNGLTFKPMIRLASIADATFAPYSNICPITGWNSVTVNRTGKNLLPKMVAGTYTSSGITVVVDDTGAATVNISTGGAPEQLNVPLESGIVVTQAMVDGVYYHLNNTLVNPSVAPTLESAQNLGVMAPTTGILNRIVGIPDTAVGKTINRIRFWAGANITASGTYAPAFMLDSTATAYEPYQGNTYTIQLGETVYGGTLDVVNGKMTVDRAMVDLGTLTWKLTSEGLFYTDTLVGNIKPAAWNTEVTESICSVYVANTGSLVYQKRADCAFGLDGNGRMYIYDSTKAAMTAAEFKTAMSGVQLCYPLATPFELTLTPEQIATLQGTNNVWSDAGDVTVTYRASAS